MNALLKELKEFSDTAVCPVADHCMAGFVSGAYTGWGWAREWVGKTAKKYSTGIPEEAVVLFKDGDCWFAVEQNFQNLQESRAGYGDSPNDAIQNLNVNQR